MGRRVVYEAREHWFEVVREWSAAVFYSIIIVVVTIAMYLWLSIPEILLGLGLVLLPAGALGLEVIRRDNIRYTVIEIDGEYYVSRKERSLRPPFRWRIDEDPKENKTLTIEGNIFADFFGYVRVWVRFGMQTTFVGLRVPREFIEMYRVKASEEELGELPEEAWKISAVERLMDKGYVSLSDGKRLIGRLLA